MNLYLKLSLGYQCIHLISFPIYFKHFNFCPWHWGEYQNLGHWGLKANWQYLLFTVKQIQRLFVNEQEQ